MAPSRTPLALDAHGRLLLSLARTIDHVLAPLSRTDRPTALVGFPRTPNVGDSAIWLGAMTALARRGLRPVYTCDDRTYSRETLARRIGEGTILLSGGGNFGDLYTPQQRLRESVVRDFPGHRIVQLPQTIYFKSQEAIERARDVFDAHADVTLLVRDARSLAFARKWFRAPSHLCPDMALALGSLSRPVQPSRPIVWLSRNDGESLGQGVVDSPPAAARADWLEEGVTPGFRLSRRIRWLLAGRPRLERLLTGAMSRAYDLRARERLRRGTRLLSSGRVVVTDRLHGHILCLLLRIPHVLLDNSYGKVRGFYEAWTRDSPLVEWGASESAGLARAAELAGIASDVRRPGPPAGAAGRAARR